MGRRILFSGVCATVLLAALVFAGQVEAAGPREFGLSVGVDLTQQNAYYVSQYTPNTLGGQFDSARLAVGGYADLAKVFLPQMRLVLATDAIIESDLKIFSAVGEVRYLFAQRGKSNGYAGGGIGVHFLRPDAGQNDTRISLNIPVGFQRKLSESMGWFGEMRFVIADQQADSSFRFSLGLTFGSGD